MGVVVKWVSFVYLTLTGLTRRLLSSLYSPGPARVAVHSLRSAPEAFSLRHVASRRTRLVVVEPLAVLDFVTLGNNVKE